LYEKCLSLQKYPNRGNVPPELSLLGIDDFLELSYKPYRIILFCRSDNTHLTYNVSKSTKQERKEKQAILNAMGLKMVVIPPPEYHKIECSICLKKIHKGEQKTLDCGHMFHWSCIRHWALTKDENGNIRIYKTHKKQKNTFI
jgi:hypothetical protein